MDFVAKALSYFIVHRETDLNTNQTGAGVLCVHFPSGLFCVLVIFSNSHLLKVDLHHQHLFLDKLILKAYIY